MKKHMYHIVLALFDVICCMLFNLFFSLNNRKWLYGTKRADALTEMMRKSSLIPRLPNPHKLVLLLIVCAWMAVIFSPTAPAYMVYD